ncbi:hypothetical protein niasHT_007769 [Heterodera trifolii]|uniref:Cyclin N-terminal domain-containing protein n=1 Tax=Heterodera trifolii TaxID=157864 RepID=A0ABD2LN48_9BILA
MSGIFPTSSALLGKKPDWRLTTEQISKLPSLIDGIDQSQELKMRQQAAQFIQDMAERLNHNVQQRGKINQVCICVSMVHMHRFFVVHSFKIFDPRDVAAACVFLAGKSEECPRKLEHVVEAWFKLKNMKAEVQPPFTETVRRGGAELIVFLESVLLQTIGFDLQVELPHPLVLHHMNCYAGGNSAISRCAYWFASEMIRLTTFPVRYSIQTIACLSIFLVSLWSDLEIPDSNGVPWFKSIEPEMTMDLLNTLADEFTLLYHECGSSECRKAVDLLQRLNQSSTATSSTSFMVHQLPPPPPPPNLSAVKTNQAHQQQKTPDKVINNDQQRQRNKRPAPARTGQNEEPSPAKRTPTDAVPSLAKVSRTATPGDKLQLPHPTKLESNSVTASNNVPSVKNCTNEKGSRDAEATDSTRNETPTSSATKKKISLNEYKQRLKMKQEPVVDELF